MTGDLLSHPHKKLTTHLSEVARIAILTLQEKNLDFSIEINDKRINLTELFPDLTYFVTIFHDLGKATGFFQKYIRHPEELHDQRKSHALLSALFVYYVISIYLRDKPLDEDLKQLLTVFAYTTVKRHHGKLDHLSNEVYIEEYDDLLNEQVNAIAEIEISKIVSNLLKDYNLTIEWKAFKKFITQKEYEEMFDEFSFDYLDDTYKELPEKTKLTLFYFHQLLYATLLFSDKNEVILDKKTNSGDKPDIIGKIQDYRVKKGFDHPRSEIDELKNKAFFSASEHLEKVFDKTKHIYSVTLPTGLGKTITAFLLGDKLRRMTGHTGSGIIITIPFTSIIDQNFEVFADILQTKRSDILLKHHHLADPEYKSNENIADYDKSKFLIETWQSDVVVTTFVQLLETFFSCDKAKLMKLSQLPGSVILLDEIQTIPYELWETVREGFKILGEKYNIYFILISATQPLIFTPGEDIIELVPDYKKYFSFFNRTRLIIHKKTVDFENFKAIVSNYASENPKKNTLVIVNTKNAARELFRYICDEINPYENELYFLSTFITPYERKQIINMIKNHSGKRMIIVSTQLVEAGVDISMDTVFREIAPLDSIIQAAGRANRYGEHRDVSEIYLYDINDLKKSRNLIYGNDLLLKTENVLRDFDMVEEKDYLELIEKYFIEVRKQSDNTSNKLLKAMQNLNFGDVNLELINERKSESVFVQINTFAKKIWEEYVEIYAKKDLKPWEREALFSKIKSNFYDFVINVPIPWGRKSIVFDSDKQYGFYVSALDNPSVNYNHSEDDPSQNTGYQDTELNVISI